MVKNGRQLGRRRYRCLKCGRSFTEKQKLGRLQKILWQKFVWKRYTLKQLAGEYHRSINWVKKNLDSAALCNHSAISQPIVAVSDATFWGRGYGVLVIRCPRLKKNIHYHEIITETPFEYLKARKAVEAEGFVLEAAVIDGKRGVKAIFDDVPVQMCQFHQIQIVKRYLTSCPKLPAGKELRAITLAPTCSYGKIFYRVSGRMA